MSFHSSLRGSPPIHCFCCREKIVQCGEIRSADTHLASMNAAMARAVERQLSDDPPDVSRINVFAPDLRPALDMEDRTMGTGRRCIFNDYHRRTALQGSARLSPECSEVFLASWPPRTLRGSKTKCLPHRSPLTNSTGRKKDPNMGPTFAKLHEVTVRIRYKNICCDAQGIIERSEHREMWCSIDGRARFWVQSLNGST